MSACALRSRQTLPRVLSGRVLLIGGPCDGDAIAFPRWAPSRWPAGYYVQPPDRDAIRRYCANEAPNRPPRKPQPELYFIRPADPGYPGFLWVGYHESQESNAAADAWALCSYCRRRVLRDRIAAQMAMLHSFGVQACDICAWDLTTHVLERRMAGDAHG